MSDSHRKQDIHSVFEGFGGLALIGAGAINRGVLGIILFIVGLVLLFHAVGDYD